MQTQTDHKREQGAHSPTLPYTACTPVTAVKSMRPGKHLWITNTWADTSHGGVRALQMRTMLLANRVCSTPGIQLGLSPKSHLLALAKVGSCLLVLLLQAGAQKASLPPRPALPTRGLNVDTSRCLLSKVSGATYHRAS